MPTLRQTDPVRAWIWAQFGAAAVLLVLSLIGVIGYLAFDAAELVFSFGGAIQAFAVFPGAIISLVVNALIMRGHGAAGVSVLERVLLGIQFVGIAAMVALHFVADGLGALALIWPAYVVLAMVIVAVALARRAELRRAAPVVPVPSGPDEASSPAVSPAP